MPLGVNFRATAGYATDPAGFVAQTDTTLYSPSRGYGYINASGIGTRNRHNSVPDQIRGMHYTASHGASFRMDLPNGAGRYRLRAAFCDVTYSNTIGWRIFDGDSGVEIAAVKNGGSSTSYYDTILGNTAQNASFDADTEDFIEHEFTSDHVFIMRDTYMQSGTAIISSVWLESSSVGTEGLGGESLWICPSITNTKDDISGHDFTATLNGGMSIVSDTSNGGSKCFEFDGTNDYVSTDMQGEAGFFSKTGRWSVAAWVKFDDGSSTASHGIVGTSLGSGGYGFNLWMSSVSEGLRGDVADGSYLCYPSEGSAWPDTNWHHVAFVSDGTTATLYRDGVSVSTQALAAQNTAWAQPVSYPVLFGAYSSSGSLAGVMDGRMDDIRIFRRPLSQAELTKLASKRGVLGKSNPEGLGDEAVWVSPTQTGTNADIANNGGTYFGGKGQAKYSSSAEVVASTGSGGAKAFEFAGGTERVTFDQKIAFQKDKPHSISFWMKPDALPSNLKIILSKMEAGSPYTGWNLYTYNAYLTFDAIANNNTKIQVSTPTSSLTSDWQHIACTWDGVDAPGVSIFINGEKQTLTTAHNNWGAGQNMLTHEEYMLGGRGADTSYPFLGQLDDYRGYARVLSEAEIAHLATSRSVTGKPTTQTQVIADAVTYVPLQEQGTTFYCQKTNIAGTLTDSSSSGRHVAGPTKFLSNAVKFSASAQRKIAFASVPSGLAGMTKYTISAWVKAQVSSTAQRTVVGWDNNTTSTSYSLRTHNGTSAKGPDLYHAGSAIIQQNTEDNANAWQHIVVQVDTATGARKSYIDGQLDSEATGGTYATVNATLNSFGIGATFNGSVANYHDAAIAGVGIWDKILTPVEINALYSGYGRKLEGLRDEKLWIVPSRTGDKSNVMYPAHAVTQVNGSLSVIDDIDERGTKAIQFNDQSSTSNNLEWDDNTDSDPVTISFWVEGSALFSSYDVPALIGKAGYSALRLHTDPQDMNYMGTLGFSGDSNWTSNAWAGSGSSAEWHHIAVVRDYQNYTKFYVDGTLVHTGSADDTTAGDWDASTYFIGVDKGTNYSDNNFLGKIDDFRVIDGAATSGEIGHLAQYRGVLGGPYVECESGSFSLTGNDANLIIPVRLNADVAAFSVTGQAAHGNWIPEGLGTEIMWVCPTYTGDRSNLAPSQNATGTNGTLSVINDTSEQGLRAFDCSVTNNNNNNWTFNLGSTRDPCVLSFWIKRTSTGGYRQNICAQTGVSGVLQVMLASSTNSASDTDELYFWNDGNSSSSTTAINGTWHHVIMERDFGGTNRFFLDGVAYGTSAGDGSASNAFGGTMTFVTSPNHSNGSYNIIGLLDDVRIIPGSLTSSEIAHLSSRRGVQGAPTTAVSMSADVATFALTGQAATLKENVNLSASTGSFTLTGVAAQLNVKMSLAAGSFTLSGQAAGLTQQVKMSAGVGSFALSGQAADLVYGQKVAAGTGAFSLTGVNASLIAATNLTIGVGSFTLTGNATDGLDIKLRVQSGSFTLAGITVGLQTSSAQQLGAAVGSFVVSPQNTTSFAVEINLTAGLHAVSGVNAPLDIAAITSAASFAAAGHSVFLGLTFGLAAGNFQVSGTSLPPIPGSQRPNPYYYRFLMQDE